MDTTARTAEVTVTLGEPQPAYHTTIIGGGPDRRHEMTRVELTNLVRVDRPTGADRITRPWRVHSLELSARDGRIYVTFRRLVADGSRDHNGRGIGVWTWTGLADVLDTHPGVARAILAALAPQRVPGSDVCATCASERDAHGPAGHTFVPTPNSLAAFDM